MEIILKKDENKSGIHGSVMWAIMNGKSESEDAWVLKMPLVNFFNNINF